MQVYSYIRPDTVSMSGGLLSFGLLSKCRALMLGSVKYNGSPSLTVGKVIKEYAGDIESLSAKL